jgi:hypothetical protein
MKRSDFVAKLNDHESPWVTDVVALAEAAGVVWDPEEEPLPERLSFASRLQADEVGNLRPGLLIEGGVWGDRDQEIRTYAEAVRRWNAWPELRALVDCLGDDGPAQHLLAPEDARRRRMLLAIFDGKEGE